MLQMFVIVSTIMSLTVIRAWSVHIKIIAKKNARKTKLRTAPVRRPSRFETIQVIPKLKIRKLALSIA